MTDRERLIDLLRETFDEQCEKIRLVTAEHTADFLLANGVLVPTCKVGDKVYYVRYHWGNIVKTRIEKIILKGSKLYIKIGYFDDYEVPCSKIGESVFFSRLEAEKALRERR